MNIKKFVTVIALIALSMMSCASMREYKRRIAEIQIDNIDLQQVADGEYTGDYDAILVKVQVLVKVTDHRIADIQLLRHDNGRGKAAEVLPGQVIEAQSLEVDTITGATSSSKVILEAIEQALKKGVVAAG